MAKHLQIQPVAGNEPQALSKEQKRFNNYVRKIQKLRNDIEFVKEQDLKLRRIGEGKILPVEKKAMEASSNISTTRSNGKRTNWKWNSSMHRPT